MSLTKLEKEGVLSNFGSNKNSGSTETQVALISYQINKLQSHFLKNKKDYGGRRGLLKMVSQRKKLLSYLKKKCFSRYNSLLKKLSLRR
ncbi:30S ribosomal protein S15 [Buchnera aphidicola (Nipponaphis monzeni)]|uniref:Small ribosomal subunit protein uS15 n=1 Tax=Buchnera aphidicola (Nipponaphis monzeni) TaxID=2495405 RepID=A0A455TAF3_9GAMM|nr:30S ribosomal protein S15 [Buchnera aphidicola]BBI01295.1 30S ribosomal protein S15 [Buchnera aphidicola (Nipponaphis monzeni)]